MTEAGAQTEAGGATGAGPSRPAWLPLAAAVGIGLGAAAAGLLFGRRDPRVLPVDPAEAFDAAFRARSAEYAGLKYSLWAAARLLRWGALAALLSVGAGPQLARLGRRLARGRRWPGTFVAALLLLGLLAALTLPIAYASGYRVERAYGLSTQSAAGWAADWLRETGFWTAIYAALVTGFLACLARWPRRGWLVAAGGGVLVAFAGAFLAPRVIDPLFHDFAPLEDPDLRRRIVALGGRAGIDVDRVLVMDASRRTARINAYVTGLLATRQVVLYDNLLAGAPEDELLLVVAHEIGHVAEAHVWKGLLWAVPGIFAGAWAVAAVARWGAARDPRLERPGDPAALPLLWLAVSVLLFLASPLESAISRRMEADADWISLELTRDPETFANVEKRLTTTNLGPVTPPGWIVGWFYSHPPILDRLGMAEYWRDRHGDASDR